MRVDPQVRRGDEKDQLRGRPEGVTAADGSVWVGVQAAGDAHAGGNLRLLSADHRLLDPALAYYVGTWGVVLGDERRSGRLQAGRRHRRQYARPGPRDEPPQPSDNGRSYTFQLRPSRIRFSNGKEVTPSDVRATFERIFRAYGYEEAQKDANGKLLKPVRDPSPGLDYYAGIVGAKACKKHPRTAISRAES